MSFFRRLQREEKGLTMIELMIVLVIVSMLLAIGTASFLRNADKAANTVASTNLYTAAQTARTDFYVNFQQFSEVDQLVNVLNASEPGLVFVAGTDYVQGQISVERRSDDIVKLRTQSESGLLLEWQVAPYDYTQEVRRFAEPDSSSGDIIYNHVINPSVENASFGSFFSGTFTFDRSSAWSVYGTYSAHWNGMETSSNNNNYIEMRRMSDIDPETQYSLSFDAYTVDGFEVPPRVRILWFDNSDAQIQNQLIDNELNLLEGRSGYTYNNIDPPNNADYGVLRIENTPGVNTAIPVGDIIDVYFDAFMLTENSNEPFFDGSFPASEWLGDVNNSVSQKNPLEWKIW